jgi:two-component system chemotaxis sensor kinase CheA
MAGKSNQNAEILSEFVMESRETLDKVEPLVTELEGGATSIGETTAILFRCFHSFKGTATYLELRHTAGLAHGAEALLDLFRRGASIEAEHVQLLRRALHTLRANLDVIDRDSTDDSRSMECHEVTSALGSAIATIRSAGTIPVSSLKRPPLHVRRLDGLESPPEGDVAVPAKTRATPSVVPGSGALRSNDASGGGHRARRSIRVAATKLDALMNLIGELVVAETAVTENPDLDGHDFENFQRAALHLHRLTRALEDFALVVRVLPLEGTFRKMVRLVRMLAADQKKCVDLVSSGGETELDNTLVETIQDAFVQLICNAMDHGIESPEERARRGKGAVGKLMLVARQKSGAVEITVRDDGRGLDAPRILRTAVERGIADPTRCYSQREIYEFIFLAGFSTAPHTTAISGRGVGLDVVRRNIEGVNGRIDVVSEPGEGTTFVLRIPPFLALLGGMLVRVGTSLYIIPLLSVRETVRAKKADISLAADGIELLGLRNLRHPIIKLGELHQVSSAARSAIDGTLVVVEYGENRVCVLVDEVMGERQTVISPLPKSVRQLPGLAGCSILPDGAIRFILDVRELVALGGRAA